MEDLAKVQTEATYASEFRYRNPLIEENTVMVAISQSGETADASPPCAAKEKGTGGSSMVNVVAPPSPARLTAASISTPGRKSASPQPKPSPANASR